MSTRPPTPDDNRSSICGSAKYQCGQIHLTRFGTIACRAHTKQPGNPPCTNAPVNGGYTCAKHGSARGTPARTAADGRARYDQARIAEERMAGELAQLADLLDVPDQHPLDGLLEAVHRAARMVRALEHLTLQLDVEPEITRQVDFDQSEDSRKIRVVGYATNASLFGPNHLGDAAPHVLVEMLAKWTDIHTRACKIALDAGIDERRLRLAENDVDQLMHAITRALVAAEFTPAQQEAFTMSLAGELRALGPA